MRVALVNAIAARAAAAAEVEKVERASERADALRGEASRRLEKARAALEDAQANGGREIAAQLLAGGDALEASPIAAAERAVAAAEESEERSGQVRDLLRQERENAAREFERAQREVETAASEVVKAEVPAAALFHEAQRVQEGLIALRLKLRWLHRGDMLGDELAARVRRFLFDNKCLPATIGQTEFADFDRHPISLALREAFAALADDADARLPF